jgi:hypothetical protein
MRRALKDWATPYAGLGVRQAIFQRLSTIRRLVDNYRTYRVYASGREPEGTGNAFRKRNRASDRSQQAKDKTRLDRLGGKRVFEESDLGSFRRYEPEVIEEFTKPPSQRLVRVVPRKDGTIPGARGFVTERGLDLLLRTAPCVIAGHSLTAPTWMDPACPM